MPLEIRNDGGHLIVEDTERQIKIIQVAGGFDVTVNGKREWLEVSPGFIVERLSQDYSADDLRYLEEWFTLMAGDR